MVKRRIRGRQERSRRAPHQVKSSRPLVIVVGEGETEDQYVRALARQRYDGKIALSCYRQPGKGDSRRTDLKNLVRHALQAEKRSRAPRGVWIICDRDKNARHRQELEEWLESSVKVRSRVRRGVSMNVPEFEYWLVLHFQPDLKCSQAKEAEKHLRSVYLPGYRKGQEFSAEIINAADKACERARKANQTSGASSSVPEDSWSAIRWSGMPELIAYCDSLAKASNPM